MGPAGPGAVMSLSVLKRAMRTVAVSRKTQFYIRISLAETHREVFHVADDTFPTVHCGQRKTKL